MTESNTDELNKIRERAKAFQEVSLASILTDSFISEQTDFHSLEELTDASGIESLEETKSAGFIKFIKTRTKFDTWDELVEEAFVEYIKTHLDD